jgi:hypothetical protein
MVIPNVILPKGILVALSVEKNLSSTNLMTVVAYMKHPDDLTTRRSMISSEGHGWGTAVMV